MKASQFAEQSGRYSGLCSSKIKRKEAYLNCVILRRISGDFTDNMFIFVFITKGRKTSHVKTSASTLQPNLNLLVAPLTSVFSFWHVMVCTCISTFLARASMIRTSHYLLPSHH